MDEPPTNPETPVVQDPAKDEPEIPLTPSCEEPPEIPNNPEPNKIPKVTRRASGALDKAQKRVRRLSVPGNFLSFLTRRKSGIWNDDMKNPGNREQQEVIVNESEGESETSPQETEDKGMENEEKHEEVKDGSDQSSDNPDGKTEEEPIPQNDMECKDIDANSRKDEEIQQEEDLSKQETLQDTEVKNSQNAEQSKDEQMFWRCLSGPVEKEAQLGVADLQNVLIDTLCLETLHLNRKCETKERCLYDYLDLAGHGTASKFSSTVELIRKPVVEVCVPASAEKSSKEWTESVMQEDSREDGEGQVDAKEEEEQRIPEDGGKHEEEVDVRKEITEDLDTVKDQDFENAEKTELIADLTSEETAQAQNQQESELKEETKRDEPSEAELKKEETPAEKESRHEASPEEIHSAGTRDENENVTTDQSDEPRNLTETDSQNDLLANDTAEMSELQTDSPACSETQREEVSSEKANGVSLDKKVPKATKQVSFVHANELVELTEKSHSVLFGNSNAEAPHAESNGSLHHNISHHNDESGLSAKNEPVSQYGENSFLPTQHNISF